MEFANRPCHLRSKSSPVPSSEPWGESISPSPSMIIPCGSDLSVMCGLGEALEGMIYPDELEDMHHDDDMNSSTNVLEYQEAAVSPTTVTAPLTPNKVSSDSLCQEGVSSHCSSGNGSTQQSTPPASPTTGYQKRGRFLIWPVTMEPPSMSLPFFGLTPQ